MKKFFLFALVAVLALGVVPVQASALGAAETHLIGKTCRGTYDSGFSCPTCQGALYVRFYDKGGRLALERRILTDRAAFKNPLADIPASEGQEVRAVEVTDEEVAIHIQFRTQSAARHDLTYRLEDRTLTGTIDPRWNPARSNWPVSAVNMSCSEAGSSASLK